jgi:Arc/MetJ family transcription regulator
VREQSENAHLRINTVIDDALMAATLKATGLKTRREVVEQGLRALRRLTQQTELRKLRGKYGWVGDLDAMGRARRSWSIRASASTSSVTSRRRRPSGWTGTSASKAWWSVT